MIFFSYFFGTRGFSILSFLQFLGVTGVVNGNILTLNSVVPSFRRSNYLGRHATLLVVEESL